MECIQEIAVLYKPLKAFSLPSWSLAVLAVDDIGEGIGGWELGGMMSMGGWTGGAVEEWNVDRRDRWGWVARNSSVEGMLSSSFNKELSLQARIPVDCCWGTVVSSSSSSEGKKSDDGWFLEVLGRDSDCEGSHQLELFKVEMVAVHESTTSVGQARSFVMLGPGQGASVASGSRVSKYEEGLHLVGSRGSYAREFLGKGRGFKDTF